MKTSDFIKEVINNAYDKQVYLTRFLTLSEQEELVYACGRNLNVYFDGGFEGAKLKRALISLFEIDDLNLNVICIKLSASNKFYTLRHPTVKWHFFNLGFDSRMFGDIILVDSSFVVVIAKEVFDTVMNETISINRCPIEYDIIDNVVIEDTKEVFKVFCSGLRLDNVTAKTFHFSRDKSKKFIENEKVYINSQVIKKLTYEVRENDIINIRGYGKVIIKKITVNNKSGKYIIIHNRFLHKK